METNTSAPKTSPTNTPPATPLPQSKNNSKTLIILLSLLATTFLALLYFLRYKNLPKTSTPPEEIQPTDSISSKPSLPPTVETDGMTHFKNDALGLEFDYPQSWGIVTISPAQTITSLATVNKDYINREDDFYAKYMLRLSFSQNNNTRIELINEKYRGELYPNGGAINFGPMDNFAKIKATGDICQYQVNYDQDIFHASDLYSVCRQGINEVVVKMWQDASNFENYQLQRQGYHRLQNGYFDNFLLVNRVTTVQSHDTTKDLTLSEVKSKLDSSKDQKEVRDLVSLLKSVKTYSPPTPTQPVFQNIPNEDTNITLIRRYYFLLTTHQFETASQLTANVSLKDITSWYQNVVSAEPRDFKKFGELSYEFLVDYQDENTSPIKYLIQMSVVDNKVKTLKSEKLLTDYVNFGNMSAVVKERQDQNYLVLTKDGQEHILDKAKSSYSDTSEISEVLVFRNLKFSSTGRFLVYGSVGWEWYFVKIVDTQNLKNVKLDLPSASTVEFNNRDNKLFTCAQNEMSGDSYASVFDLNTLKVVKDFLKDSTIDTSTGVNINCSFDRNTQTAIVKLSSWDESKPGQNMEMVID